MSLVGDIVEKFGSTFVRVFKFGIVGLSGVFVNLLVSEFLFRTVLLSVPDDGLRLAVSNALGVVVSIFTNFVLNDRWTFGDMGKRSSWWSRLAKYYLTASVAGLVQIGVSYVTFEFVFDPIGIVVAGVDLDSTLSICTGIGAGTVINYLASYFWTFRE